MKSHSSCPCCSGSMLLHLSSRRSFWRCSHCRLEMPETNPQSQLNKSTAIQFNKSSLTAAIAPKQSAPTFAAI